MTKEDITKLINELDIKLDNSKLERIELISNSIEHGIDSVIDKYIPIKVYNKERRNVIKSVMFILKQELLSTDERDFICMPNSYKYYLRFNLKRIYNSLNPVIFIEFSKAVVDLLNDIARQIDSKNVTAHEKEFMVDYFNILLMRGSLWKAK